MKLSYCLFTFMALLSKLAMSANILLNVHTQRTYCIDNTNTTCLQLGYNNCQYLETVNDVQIICLPA